MQLEEKLEERAPCKKTEALGPSMSRVRMLRAISARAQLGDVVREEDCMWSALDTPTVEWRTGH